MSVFLLLFLSVTWVDVLTVSYLDTQQELKRRDPSAQIDCGGLLSTDSGNMTSLGFPSHLPTSYTRCSWRVIGPRGYRVKLDFVVFDLPPPNVHESCHAALVMYGGYNAVGERVIHNEVCGKLPPKSFVSSTPSAWVTLVVTGLAPVAQYEVHAGVDIHFTLIHTDLSDNQLLVGLVCGLLFPLLCCIPMVWYYNKRHKVPNWEARELARTNLERKRKLINSVLQKQQRLSPTIKPIKAPEMALSSNSVFYKSVVQDLSLAELSDIPTNAQCDQGEDLTARQGATSNRLDIVNKPQTLTDEVKDFEKTREAKVPSPAPSSYKQPLSRTELLDLRCLNSPASSTPKMNLFKVRPCPYSAPCHQVRKIMLDSGYTSSPRTPTARHLRTLSHRKRRFHKLSLAFRAPSMGSISEVEERSISPSSDKTHKDHMKKKRSVSDSKSCPRSPETIAIDEKTLGQSYQDNLAFEMENDTVFTDLLSTSPKGSYFCENKELPKGHHSLPSVCVLSDRASEIDNVTESLTVVPTCTATEGLTESTSPAKDICKSVFFPRSPKNNVLDPAGNSTPSVVSPSPKLDRTIMSRWTGVANLRGDIRKQSDADGSPLSSENSLEGAQFASLIELQGALCSSPSGSVKYNVDSSPIQAAPSGTSWDLRDYNDIIVQVQTSPKSFTSRADSPGQLPVDPEVTAGSLEACSGGETSGVGADKSDSLYKCTPISEIQEVWMQGQGDKDARLKTTETDRNNNKAHRDPDCKVGRDTQEGTKLRGHGDMTGSDWGKPKMYGATSFARSPGINDELGRRPTVKGFSRRYEVAPKIILEDLRSTKERSPGQYIQKIPAGMSGERAESQLSEYASSMGPGNHDGLQSARSPRATSPAYEKPSINTLCGYKEKRSATQDMREAIMFDSDLEISLCLDEMATYF